MRTVTSLVRCLLLGLATGGRSQSGLGALVLRPPTASRWWFDRLSRTRVARVLAVGAIGGEVVIDKLPITPSRLIPPQLAARVAAGAGVGAIAARRDGGRGLCGLAAGAMVGAVGAAVGSFAGARWRAFAAAKAGGDLPGAFAEDAASLALAFAVVRCGD